MIRYIFVGLFIILGQVIIWDLWHNVWINMANILMWVLALMTTTWKER